MLGEHPELYPLDEKWSIIEAYKQGGGAAGIHEIIENSLNGSKASHRSQISFDSEFNDRAQLDVSVEMSSFSTSNLKKMVKCGTKKHDYEIDLSCPCDKKVIEREFE